MLEVKRCGENPLLIPENVKPSREDFKVEGVFNCGVAKYKDEVILAYQILDEGIIIQDMCHTAILKE